MGNLTKSAIIAAVLMILSKCLGLFREILLANYFGTTYIVDAYSIACILPSVLFALMASGFASSYIPVIFRIKSESDRIKFFSNTTCILTIISLAISVFCFLFAGAITKVMAPGFEGEAYILTKSFISIIVFHLPFFTIFNIFCAQAAVDEDFNFAFFCDLIVVNLLIILAIYLAHQTVPYWLSYGYVLAMIVATFLLGAHLVKRGKTISFQFNLRDNNFNVLAKMALPIGVSFLANQINAVADKMFSSTLGEGVTSALSYANRLQLLPYSLIVSVFVSVCNPKMNRYFAEGNEKEGLFYAKKALLITIYISFPIVLQLFFNAKPITALLFKRGQFGVESTIMTAKCLQYYSFGILFYAIRQISSNVFTANLKQKIILKNTVISVILNIILNFSLIQFMGYAGLALSTSIAGFIAAVLMIIDLEKTDLSIFDAEQFGDFIRILICSVVSLFVSLIAYGICDSLIISKNLLFVFSLVVFAFVYLGLSITFNINIVIWLYKHMPQWLRLIQKWN